MSFNKKLSVALLSLLPLVGCTVNTSSQASQEKVATDSVEAVVEEEVAPVVLVGDSLMNKAARFYAGVDKTGIPMSDSASRMWSSYCKDIDRYMTSSRNVLAMVDSLARTDFSDFRSKVDYVFYPFSGADFLYPLTLFPDADTYFMCGLERPGTPITQISTNPKHLEAYRTALINLFYSSYFITKDMSKDLHNSELDGTCPVLSMLMALSGYEIISVNYFELDSIGNMVAAEEKSRNIEMRFFKTGSTHEQRILYFSGDVQNKSFKPALQAYIDKELPQHTVASYIKAASYLLHWDSFSQMRDNILNHSIAIVQDDSGIPYRKLTPGFDVTLYGKYIHPWHEFAEACNQKDLEAIYEENAATIHTLPFRIGYNKPSNWQCARRKKTL